MRHKPQLIVFDFDGTLADTLPVFVGAFNEAAARHRFKPIEQGSHGALRGLGAREIMALHGIGFWKVPFITRTMRASIARDIGQVALFAGVAAELRALHGQGATLAIVSSN